MLLLKFILFFCVIFNTACSNDIEDLKEQSLVYGIALESDNSTKCGQELKIFIEAVEKRQKWALNMLDSSGQEGVSYLFVNFIWMGSMSQCQNINNYNNLAYHVDFMSTLFKHNNTMQMQYNGPNNNFLQIGLCLPRTCSIHSISAIIERVINKRELLFLQNYPVELSLIKIKSLAAEDNDWMMHPVVIFTLLIILATVLLTAISLSTDYSSSTSLWAQILRCYSFPENVRKLFDTTKTEDSFPIVHGLKALGMFYIIGEHISLYISTIMNNVTTLARYNNVWYFQIFIKGTHSVDTFFCLSGFLMSYLFYKFHKDKKPYTIVKGSVMFCQMMVHRILRLLPTYIVTIGSVVTIWRYLDKTYPLHRLIDHADDTCPRYWWRNLLFITTLYPRKEMCITWTWYISHDMQFYCLTCVLLISSTNFPKTVLVIVKSLIAYSILRAGLLSYTIPYIHTLDDFLLNEVFYYDFSIRMTSYFVGVLAGSYFYKWNGKLPLTNKGYRTGWVLCLAAFLYVVHGLNSPTQYYLEYVAFYVGFSKFLWSSCVAWVILACSSGYGGIFSKMLSHKCWIPFSRASFGVYFTNLIVINMYAYTGEDGFHFTNPFMFNLNLGDITCCFLFGALFSLLFETPYIKLIKLLINPKKNVKNNVDPEFDKCKLKSKLG